MSSPPPAPIPGLCGVCAMSAAEMGKIDVLEPFGSPYDQGWRTVSGVEMHQLLYTWSTYGHLHVEDVRITHPCLDGGEERLPMLPVTTVDGVACCAQHIVNILDSRRRARQR